MESLFPEDGEPVPVAPVPPRPAAASGPVVEDLVRRGYDRRALEAWGPRKAHAFRDRLDREARLRPAPRRASWEVAADGTPAAADRAPLAEVGADWQWVRGVLDAPPDDDDGLRAAVRTTLGDLPYWALYDLLALAEANYRARYDRLLARCEGQARAEQPREGGGGDDYVEYE